MKRLQTTVSLLLILALTSCAGREPSSLSGEVSDASSDVYLAYTPHRMGELEPCGCSQFPEGGLQREFELYRREAFKGLKASGGVSFVPFPENFNAAQAAHYLRKSGFLVEGLNQLGTNVLAPNIEDFLLGVDNVRTLAKKAKFPFTSANIVDKKTGKLVFPAYHEISKGGALFTFIGLSAAPYVGYPAPAEVELKDPAQALDAVLESLGETRSKRVIIVLTSLSSLAQKKLRNDVGGVHFYFGGDLIEPEPGFFQERPNAVWTNPKSRGRSVALLKLTPKLPISYLHNETVSATYRALVEARAGELKGLQGKLKGKKLAKKARMEAEARAREIEKELPSLEMMTLPVAGNFTPYEGKVVVLGGEYTPKDQPFAPLLDSFHEATRSAALHEAEVVKK
jgi:hypothetical protein